MKKLNGIIADCKDCRVSKLGKFKFCYGNCNKNSIKNEKNILSKK